jgi:hypothetical protein
MSRYANNPEPGTTIQIRLPSRAMKQAAQALAYRVRMSLAGWAGQVVVAELRRQGVIAGPAAETPPPALDIAAEFAAGRNPLKGGAASKIFADDRSKRGVAPSPRPYGGREGRGASSRRGDGVGGGSAMGEAASGASGGAQGGAVGAILRDPGAAVDEVLEGSGPAWWRTRHEGGKGVGKGRRGGTGGRP